MKINQPATALGRFIRRRIAQLGISQSELARRAGLNRELVSSVIRQKYTPSHENLKLLAKALEVEVGELQLLALTKGQEKGEDVLPIIKKIAAMDLPNLTREELLEMIDEPQGIAFDPR